MSIILSAYVGKNAETFARILSIYGRDGMTIADVTYGRGNFWTSVPIGIYKLLATDMETGTDCRHLPYEDGSIDIVVLDPPYIYNPKGTIKASLSSTYNVNKTEGLTTVHAVLDLYREAMAEAVRIVAKGGYIVVKCQDQIMSGRQYWVHLTLYEYAREMGLVGEDLFVLVQPTQPTIRWPIQKHARKNHSYFWVFRK